MTILFIIAAAIALAGLTHLVNRIITRDQPTSRRSVSLDPFGKLFIELGQLRFSTLVVERIFLLHFLFALLILFFVVSKGDESDETSFLPLAFVIICSASFAIWHSLRKGVVK